MHDQAPQASPAQPGQLLTASQVMEKFGVDRSTVYRMALDGRLPAVKVGRQWRFPATDIDAVITVAGRLHTASSLPLASPNSRVRFDSAAATALLELTAERLGVMMLVTDMDGRPLTPAVNPSPWFIEHGDEPRVVEACLAERRMQADDLALVPSFQLGLLGFECARAFIRDGSSLVGMVLAGGVVPMGESSNGFYALDTTERARVLDTLPRVAAALSRTQVRPQHDHEETR